MQFWGWHSKVAGNRYARRYCYAPGEGLRTNQGSSGGWIYFWTMHHILFIHDYISIFQFNFVGRILGPRGMTAKQLEHETGCKIMVRGRGSLRDNKKVSIHFGCLMREKLLCMKWQDSFIYLNYVLCLGFQLGIGLYLFIFRRKQIVENLIGNILRTTCTSLSNVRTSRSARITRLTRPWNVSRKCLFQP